jgi:hypothetical protein
MTGVETMAKPSGENPPQPGIDAADASPLQEIAKDLKAGALPVDKRRVPCYASIR